MTGPRYQVTKLPPAGRDDQVKRWGLSASHRWAEAERRQCHDDDLGETEDDGGCDHGQELGFILDGGWMLVDSARGHAGIRGATGGARDAGMSAHRGVLQADEYVDPAAFQALAEVELGFTFEEVRSVYRQGPKSAEQVALRALVGARLLALASAGGNLIALGRAFGWDVEDGNGSGGASCRTMERAIKRAREEAS